MDIQFPAVCNLPANWLNKDGNLVFTNSMLHTFFDCPYKFYLEYVELISPTEEPIYFTWGTIVHETNRIIASGGTPESADKELREYFEKQQNLSDRRIGQIEAMLQLIPMVYDAYLLYRHKEDECYEDLATEIQFEYQLAKGIVIRGKIDRIVRDIRTSEKHLWEYKTPAQTGDSYYERLVLDSQLKTYLLMCNKCIGHNVTRVIYDAWKKPQQQQKWLDELPGAYAERVGRIYLLSREKQFERRYITFTQEQLERYMYELKGRIAYVLFAVMNSLYPKHHPGNRIGRCAFQRICEYGDEQLAIDNAAYTIRSKDRINPELESERILK